MYFVLSARRNRGTEVFKALYLRSGKSSYSMRNEQWHRNDGVIIREPILPEEQIRTYIWFKNRCPIPAPRTPECGAGYPASALSLYFLLPVPYQHTVRRTCSSPTMK